MTAHISWDHLSTPTQIRHRAQVLAEAHTGMLSDLVQLRVSRGMKQADVAAILGTTQQNVSKLESYDANPRIDTLQAYANAVGAVLDIKVRRADAVAPQTSQNSWEPSDRLPKSASLQSASRQNTGRHMKDWSDETLYDSKRVDFALGA